MKATVVLTTAVALIVMVSPGIAQTLTQPNPPPQPSPPAAATKSRPTAGHVKVCDAYGAGFMNVPGTDACIKVGGGVTVQAGH